MNSLPRRLLPLVFVLAAFAVAAPSAAALDKNFCVGTVTTVTCENAYPLTRAGLQQAIDRADDPAPGFAGRDSVVIGPGTIDVDGTVTISPPFGEPVDVIGSGRSQTVLQIVDDGGVGTNRILLTPGILTDSSLQSLNVKTSFSMTSEIAVLADGGRIDDVDFDVIGGQDSFHRGVMAPYSNPVTITDSVFDCAGGGYYAVDAGAGLTISDTRITHAGTWNSDETIAISAGGDLDAARLDVRGAHVGVYFNGDDGEIRDSLIKMGSTSYGTNQEGVGVQLGVGLGTGDRELRMRGVTVIGATDTQFGAYLFSFFGSTANGHLRIYDSLLMAEGTGSRDIACSNNGTGTATVTVSNSLHDQTDFSTLSGTPCAATTANGVDRRVTPPLFADAAAGDYRAAAGSPVIDAGNDDSDRPAPKLDLDRVERFADGNGDGTPIIDIGAYELQHPFPPPAAPPANPADLSLTLGKPVGKIKLNRKKGKRKLKRTGFALTTARKKPRIPVTTNLDASLKLELARYRAGYVKGSKCVKRKPSGTRRARRCDLAVKGSQTLAVKAGTSYLTFGGKLGRSKLAPGRYRLIVTARGLKDSRKATLSLIR